MTTNHANDQDPYDTKPRDTVSELQKAFSTYNDLSNHGQASAVLADRVNEKPETLPTRLVNNLLIFAQENSPNGRITRETVDAFMEKQQLIWVENPDYHSMTLEDQSEQEKSQRTLEALQAFQNDAAEWVEALELREYIDTCKEFPEGHVETELYKEQAEYAKIERAISQYFSLREFSNHSIEHVKEVIEESNQVLDGLAARGYDVDMETRKLTIIAARFHDIGMVEPTRREKLFENHGKFEAFCKKQNALDAVLDKPPDAWTADEREQMEAMRAELIKNYRENPCLMALNSDAAKDYLTGRMSPEKVAELEHALEEKVGFLEKCDASLLCAQMADQHVGWKLMISGQMLDIRSEHPRQSAKYLLEHSDDPDIKERFGDVSIRDAACIALLHSKSNSGCKDLTAEQCEGSNKDLRTACTDFIHQWNAEHPEHQFDSTFTSDDLERIRMGATALRIGDGNRDGSTMRLIDGREVELATDAQGNLVKDRRAQCSIRFKDGSDEPAVENDTSKEIITGELCITPRGSDMAQDKHEQRFIYDLRHADDPQVKKQIVEKTLPALIGEMESGMLKDGSCGVKNVYEIRVDCTEAEAKRLQEEYRELIRRSEDHVSANKRKNWYTAYAENDRIVFRGIKGGQQ